MKKVLMIPLLCLMILSQSVLTSRQGPTTQQLTPPLPVFSTVTSVNVPILLYHHITEEETANSITTALFQEHMQALSQAGYTAVDFEALQNFVFFGTALPEKPVVITFDDGYQSNLTLAGPILRQYGMNATIFIIGVSIGKDTYKDTGKSMFPHFSLEETSDYADVFRFESHGYNFHQVNGLDIPPVRSGVLAMEGESADDYASFIAGDCRQMNDIFLAAFGTTPKALAYPYGYYDETSERLLHEQGILITLTTNPHTNLLTIGDKEALYLMGRYGVDNFASAQTVLDLMEKGPIA